MDPQELSAQELVQLCLDHNQKAAWEEFVRRYQPTIARVVTRTARRWTIPSPALVDDLVHDTYLKLFTNDSRALRELAFQHENAIFGFFKTVASNVVTDHFRAFRNQKRWTGKDDISLDDAAFFIPESRNSAQRADYEILCDEINKILKEELGNEFTRDHAIFWLYYHHGLTANAISKLPAIGLTVKGVESTLLRVTKLVREKMNRTTKR
jgi:RNA polymerase sigma-70 factor, ECF subfamily